MNKISLKWKLTTIPGILLISLLGSALISISYSVSLELFKLTIEFMVWCIVIVSFTTVLGYLIRKYY